MDALPVPDDAAEAVAERERRVAWEQVAVAEAIAEVEAGLYVDGDEVEAWIDSIGQAVELLPPPIRHR